MARNEEVAALLDEIADRMTVQGESGFKIRAYRDGATAIRTTPEALEDLVATRKLNELPNVGLGIADKSAVYLATGSIPLLEDLRVSVPEGQMRLYQAGMQPDAIRKAKERYRVTSPEGLRAVMVAGQLDGDLPFRSVAATTLSALAGIAQSE